jgi:asparagine synthase (glutamine-hydrolysing)
MCGICGFTEAGPPDQLERMLRLLVHRGPDEQGVHRESGVSLGARRLSVIDPDGGHQPISNEDETVWVVLNGEIYNFEDLRTELQLKGHRFATRCDTEVLAHLYEEEGAEMLHRLRGMFAFALWDRAQETLLLARDRFGIKPLYYALHEGKQGRPRVTFASELPALLQGVGHRDVRPQALLDYLTFLYVPGPETLYEGVYQLRPGEVLEFSRGRVSFTRYAYPGDLRGSAVADSLEEATERYLYLLEQTVQAHLVSDVPIGLLLSGGLDSAAILAAMRRTSNGPIRTFSIGYEASADASYDELERARLLARHFGAEHTEEHLRPDAVSLVPQVVAALGEPLADASAIPTYLIAQVARRTVTVALSGVGGDELFGGYPRYVGIRWAARYATLPNILRRGAARVARWIPEGETARDQMGRLKRFLSFGAQAPAAQYVHWTTFLSESWRQSALAPELYERPQPFLAERVRERLFDQWPSEDPSDRAMAVDLQTYLPDDLLRLADRMSMAHSLELRVPFCDPALLAFALNLPPRRRFTAGRQKGFVRQALRGVLPDAILTGPKQGFQVPLARWLREDLREMVHDVLNESAIRHGGWLNPAYVRWLLQHHESGRRNLADQIYAVLVLELWRQQARATAGQCAHERAVAV